MANVPTSTIVRQERARLAGLKKSRPDDDPEVIETSRKLGAAKLEDHVRRLVEAAPPLTDEQVDRLTALFRPRATGARG